MQKGVKLRDPAQFENYITLSRANSGVTLLIGDFSEFFNRIWLDGKS